MSSGPEFRYRTLGKTGLKVTTVGFGCMITSDGSVVERAADLGNHVFRYRSRLPERQQRAHGRRRPEEQTQGSRALHQDRGRAPRRKRSPTLDTSLKELGTDFVDIWYLHGKDPPEDVTDDLIEAQQIAKKAGKIRFAGVSTHSGQKELIPLLAKPTRTST